MEWKQTKGTEEWVSGLFRIVKRFRYFCLYFSGNLISQISTLKQAKDRAEKINNDNA